MTKKHSVSLSAEAQMMLEWIDPSNKSLFISMAILWWAKTHYGMEVTTTTEVRPIKNDD